MNSCTISGKQFAEKGPKRPNGTSFVGVLGKGTDPEQIGLAFGDSLAEEFGTRPSRSEPMEVGPLPGYLVTLTDTSGREIFGWCKAVGGLARCRFVGRWKLKQQGEVTVAAYNLLRMARLAPMI